jgi:hypothetical protein
MLCQLVFKGGELAAGVSKHHDGCPGGLLFPYSEKSLVCYWLETILVSISVRVDRDIDREETAVAAVSERYRGDNVFRVVDSPYRLLLTCAAAPKESSMQL